MITWRKPLFWILLTALALRVWGANYALPQFFVFDERSLVYGALKMAELKTLLPVLYQEEFRKVLYYSPLPSYFFLIILTPIIGLDYLFSDAANLAEYRLDLTLDPSFIFIAARLLVAAIGVLNIYTVYLLTKRLFRREPAGLWAAAFLGVSFFHIQLSHVTRHWLLAAFVVQWVWLIAVSIYFMGQKRHYFFAGLLAGLGVGINSSSAVAMIPVVTAHFFRREWRRLMTHLLDTRLLASIAIFGMTALVMILLYPYGFTQGEIRGGTPQSFLVSKMTMLASKSVIGWLAFLGSYLKLLLTYETFLFIAASAGAALAWRRDKRWVLLIAAFIIVYLTLLYLFFARIPRGMIFFLPLLAALAGFAADRFFDFVMHGRGLTLFGSLFIRNLFIGIAFALFFAWPLVMAIRYDYLLTQKDTRILAKEWVEDTLSPGTKFLVYLPNLRLTNTLAGIEELARIDPGALRVEDRALQSFNPLRYPSPAYTLLNLHFISADQAIRRISDPKVFRALGYQYLMVEYLFTDKADLDSQARRLTQASRLIQRFDQFAGTPYGQSLDIRGEVDMLPPGRMLAIDRFGPIVEIYELPR